MKTPRFFVRAVAPLVLIGMLESGTAHAAGCNLGPRIKHVVHLTFDNVHLRRDNPNVPSDLGANAKFAQFHAQQRHRERSTLYASHFTYRQ
jgi:hypothetical protein